MPQSFFLYTRDVVQRIVAGSADEAVRAASEAVRRSYPPAVEGTTYWLLCSLYDEDGGLVQRWREAVGRPSGEENA